jgi:hypothetical protein
MRSSPNGLPRILIGALSIACAGVLGCRSHERMTALPPNSDLSISEQSNADNRSLNCEKQAARVAAWRGRTIDEDIHEPSWISHFSHKYRACYVLVTNSLPVPNIAPPLVMELWDAFDATLLAESTTDPRAEVRESFCRINISEDPFTSCEVANYFIREYMTH